MFDITHETNPMPVSMWQVPIGGFCEKGGRFGTHQHAEQVNGRLNRHENRIAWIAYFNAGIRVVDVSDPYTMKQIGYYIPKINKMSHPMGAGAENGHPDQRRDDRSPRPGVCHGPRRHRAVRGRIHWTEAGRRQRDADTGARAPQSDELTRTSTVELFSGSRRLDSLNK